jgi:ribosomal protein S18 acetylase RimI-like enzyme
MNAQQHLVIRKDDWLTGLLECTVYCVQLPELLAPSAAVVETELTDCLRDQQNEGTLFAYAKVDVQALEKAHLLERVGFKLVDTSVGLECSRSPAMRSGSPSVVARLAEASDAPAVVALAENSFRFSRFHQDAHIPPGVADRIKAAWAANFFSGKRGEMMVVAESHGKVIGFLQLLLPPETETLDIDLIGVDMTLRGQGTGRAMVEAACRLSGRERLKVGTQIANFGALAFYRRLGFGITSAAYVFHFHA